MQRILWLITGDTFDFLWCSPMLLRTSINEESIDLRYDRFPMVFSDVGGKPLDVHTSINN